MLISESVRSGATLGFPSPWENWAEWGDLVPLSGSKRGSCLTTPCVVHMTLTGDDCTCYVPPMAGLAKRNPVRWWWVKMLTDFNNIHHWKIPFYSLDLSSLKCTNKLCMLLEQLAFLWTIGLWKSPTRTCFKRDSMEKSVTCQVSFLLHL